MSEFDLDETDDSEELDDSQLEEFQLENYLAAINILDSIQKMAGLMKKDILEESNTGVMAYMSLALKRHVDMLVNVTEEKIMLELMSNDTEEEDVE